MLEAIGEYHLMQQDSMHRFDWEGVPAETRALLQDDPAVQMSLRTRALIPEMDRPYTEGGDQIAAFFDIDGTLIRGSIAGHLFAQAIEEKRASRRSYLVFFFFFLLYKLNLIPRERMYAWGFSLGSGESLSTAIAFIKRCIQDRIRPRIFRGARDLVQQHRAMGHRVVAVTGAPDYAAAQVACALGFDDVLATPSPVDGDRVGGAVMGPLCYADGKVRYAKAYAAHHGVSLARSFCYSDSRSDEPLLSIVGRPVCVNPQLLLRWVAWRRRWDILQFRRMGDGS